MQSYMDTRLKTMEDTLAMLVNMVQDIHQSASLTSLEETRQRLDRLEAFYACSSPTVDEVLETVIARQTCRGQACIYDIHSDCEEDPNGGKMDSHMDPLHDRRAVDGQMAIPGSVEASQGGTERSETSKIISATCREDEDVLGGTAVLCTTLSAHSCPAAPCCASPSGGSAVESDGLHINHVTSQYCCSDTNVSKTSSARNTKRRSRRRTATQHREPQPACG